jgi:putative peptidoglycan lipid II flippase
MRLANNEMVKRTRGRSTPLPRVKYPSFKLFFCYAFVYASSVALIFQTVILPFFPELHARQGLMNNDAIIFHDMAVEVAQQVSFHGWTNWSLYPQGAAGNVGLLSLLYAVLGPDPLWFIPFNAAAHAAGATMIYRLGPRLADGGVGRVGGLFAATCFLIFPSALQWYGQNHKDAFVILGILLSLDAWLVVNDDRIRIKFSHFFYNLAQALTGLLLVGLMRPYFVSVIVLGFAISFCATSILGARPRMVMTRLALVFVLAISAIALMAMSSRYDMSRSRAENFSVGAYSNEPSSHEQSSWAWKSSSKGELIPAVFDDYLRRASEVRKHFVEYGRFVGAGSEIDGQRLPDSALAVFSYLPRALVVGLFSPFPDTWLTRLSPIRLIAAIETACFYVALVGSIALIILKSSRGLFAAIVFCTALITILSYVHPNVGTLYRQRFGLWMIFFLIGCVGWSSFFLMGGERLSKLLLRGKRRADIYRGAIAQILKKIALVRTGVTIGLITSAGYSGFLMRDILLVNRVGLGDATDIFFVSMMIVTMFVTCIAQPIGDSSVLYFSNDSKSSMDDRILLLQEALGRALLLLLAVMAFVFFATPWLVAFMLQSATSDGRDLAIYYARLMAVILLLSAWTIVGSAMLNSLNMARKSALAQLAPPLITLPLLLLAPTQHLFIFCISGMLIGTLVNAIHVSWMLYVNGFLMWPRFSTTRVSVLGQNIYFGMLVVSLYPIVSAAMNYSFASTVEEGAVSIWVLISKIVTLVTGLFGVIVAAVILPRISRGNTVVASDLRGINRRVISGAIISYLVSLVLAAMGLVFVEPVVQGFFKYDQGELPIIETINIIRVGILQVPIVLLAAIVNRLAVSVGATRYVLEAAALGLFGNVAICFALVPQFGIIGVAIGAVTGLLLFILTLMVSIRLVIALSASDICQLFVGWLSLAIICVGFILSAQAIFSAGCLMFVIMLWRYYQQYRRADAKS